MKRTMLVLLTCAVIATSCAMSHAQISKVKVAFCSKAMSPAIAPYAIATKMGWFKEEGIDVTLEVVS